MSDAPKIIRMACCGPRDVSKELGLAGAIADEWNIQHGDALNTFLKHQHWIRDGVPDLSDRPQAVLNRQIIDDSDVIAAVFWSRFGSPTGVAGSGTEEEILRGIQKKKRVLLYFSDLDPLPPDTSRDQLVKVESFRERMNAAGLYCSFRSRAQFKELFRTHLAKAVHEILERFVAQVPQIPKVQSNVRQNGVNNLHIEGDNNKTTVHLHPPKKEGNNRGYPKNSIGADANLTNYIEYLCGLWVNYMSLIEQDENALWGRIGKQIKTRFRLKKRTRHHISRDRFPDLVKYLIEDKLASTPVGKKHLKGGTKLCRTFDEYRFGEM